MKNTVTETFNIDVPIFAFSHCRDVVAAVSKAGGFGVLGAVGPSPDALEIDLKFILFRKDKSLESFPSKNSIKDYAVLEAEDFKSIINEVNL